MNIENLMKRFNKLSLQNWALWIIVVVFAVVIIIQTFMIDSAANNKEVIILPPKVNRAFSVQGNKPSKGYMIDMGEFISQTILNLNPQNYKSQINLFLQFVSPHDFMRIKLSLLKQYKVLASLQISQVFYPNSVSVHNHDILVKGTLVRVIGQKNSSESKIFRIHFKIVNGEFYVKNIGFKKTVA